MRTVLLENIHPEATKKFLEAGHKVETHKKSLAGAELGTTVHTASVIGVRSATQLTSAVLSDCKELRAIGHFSIGVENTDLKAAARRGIPVFNSPFSSTRSVAELIVAQIINLARGLGDNLCAMKANRWEKSAENKFEIRGKTLGIVGYGHIGSVLSVISEALGMRVVFYDIIPKLAYGNAKRASSLAECLSEADFLSLHVPGGESTTNMINSSTIALMKPGSYLLNASRGSVVNIPDVVDALKRKHLAGFYADVLPIEPKANGLWPNKETDEKYASVISELVQLPNVILTSHIGGSSVEAQRAIAEDVSSKLLDFLSTGSTVGCVNLPQVSLLPPRGSTESKVECYRICHFHKNVPGVLRDINNCLAKFNIVQESLATFEDIGYCIIDVEKFSPEEECRTEFAIAREKISSLPSTISLNTF